MSRPTFIKLLDEGTLAYERKGSRRKVRFTDIIEYKQDVDSKRLKSLADLSALDQELGIGY